MELNLVKSFVFLILFTYFRPNSAEDSSKNAPDRHDGLGEQGKEERSKVNGLHQYRVSTKCFDDLGCVSGNDFVYNTTLIAPEVVFTDPNEMGVTFNLFTRNNSDTPQVFDYKAGYSEINNSLFRADRETKFIIHGFLDGLNRSQWIREMKDYLLNKSDYNVVAVDWSKASITIFYFQAAADTRVVGPMVAHFINSLVNVTNVSESDMHCIGHSLGAHICGFAGQRLQSRKLGQISGLDPAGPAFLSSKNNTRLDPTDAELVVVIHTNAGILTTEGWFPIELTGIVGHPNELGHFDFWPNGDEGLGAFACNHRRSHEYPISVTNNECQYIGYECDNYMDFQNGKCAHCGEDNTKCKPMEFDFEYWDNFNRSLLPSQESPSYNYYLKTSDAEPFCLFHYQILVQISKESGKKVFGRLEITFSNQKVSFPPSLKPFDGPIEIPLMSTFEASTNYTQLYVDRNALKSTDYLLVKWSSILWAKIQIQRISINFMSHINKRVRDERSLGDFCWKSGSSISSGDTVLFEKCTK